MAGLSARRVWQLVNRRALFVGLLLCSCVDDLNGLSSGSNAGDAGSGGASAGSASSDGGGASGASSGAGGTGVAGSAGAESGGHAGSVVMGDAGAAGEAVILPCVYYPDRDGDGYGDSSHALSSCSPPSGFVATGGDCNDADPEIHPDANESCDTIDNDCNSKTKDACPVGCTATVGPVSHLYMACAASKVTSAAAETACEAQHMKLTRIDDAAENTFVNGLELALPGAPTYIWIGGTDLAQVGTWRFPDNTIFWQASASVNGLYTDWNAGEPSEGKEHCLGMWADVAMWNDFDCVAAAVPGYVCERY